MKNKYFSLKEFNELAESSGFPPHDDISNFLNRFSGTKPDYQKKCFQSDTHKADIENYCSVVESMDDFQDDRRADFDIGCLFVSIEDALTHREDMDEERNCSRLRLVPFAYTGFESYFCFYFETQTARPKIALWYKEESWEYAPVFDVIAENIDEFLEKLVASDEEELDDEEYFNY